MRCQTEGRVVSNRRIAEDIWLTTIEAAEIAGSAQPGQFVNLYFPNSVKIFPRPFSVAGVDGANIQILYKIVGTQTEMMQHWKRGDRVRMLGPLGNFFEIPDPEHEILLLAGGVGAAPLLFLCDWLFERGNKPKFFIGARTEAQLPLRSDDRSELILATDDGSAGQKALITDLFKEYVTVAQRPLTACVCGPDAMLKALKKAAYPPDITMYVSLEKTMACGLGLCQGCIVKNERGNPKGGYSLVCKDGPVFNLKDIDFNG